MEKGPQGHRKRVHRKWERDHIKEIPLSEILEVKNAAVEVVHQR